MKITGSAGHGLNTSGKRCPDDSMREFMFNVAVFNYFKAGIEKYKDANGKKVEVIAVHDPSGKVDISLANRTAHVNRSGASLHIDFHANAFGSGWNEAGGIETYVYKKTLKEAAKVAESVQKEIVAATGLKNRGVKEGNLHMIRETKPTAILIEGPFMTNKKEAELLKSDAFRKKFAAAIVKGVVNAYNLQPINPPRTIQFYTGGYTSGSLLNIHDFLRSKGWYFQPSRADNGTMMFLIGGFGEGSQQALEMEAFLKQHNYWYQIK